MRFSSLVGPLGAGISHGGHKNNFIGGYNLFLHDFLPVLGAHITMQVFADLPTYLFELVCDIPFNDVIICSPSSTPIS